MIQIQGKVLSAQLLPEKERPTILKCLEYLPKHFDFSRWWSLSMYFLLWCVCLKHMLPNTKKTWSWFAGFLFVKSVHDGV